MLTLGLRLKLVLFLFLVSNGLQNTGTLGFSLDRCALFIHDTVEFVIGQGISTRLLDALLQLLDVFQIVGLLSMLGTHLMISQCLVEFLVFIADLLIFK
jgi:hypothetical protein